MCRVVGIIVNTKYLIPSVPLCYDDYFINMTVKHKNLLNPVMGYLYVNFVGLNVSVIHMTISRSVRAKEFCHATKIS